MKSTNTLVLNRSTAIALLARLGLSDIPYVQSKQCRYDMINYLSNVILNNTSEDYDMELTIDIDDLKIHINDYDAAIQFLQYYTISK